ncbi:MAG: hypothetical protein AAF493_02280 [Pseudomonadota bacterium]
MTCKLTLAIVSVFIALTSMASAVQAENGHAYNGNHCSAWLGSQSGDFSKGPNGLRNNTPGARYVSCPVVVDEIANTTGTTRQYVYYTGNGTIRCTLQSNNHNGTALQAQSASRVGTGWIFIPQITADAYWGSYAMWCLLPGYGTINTIWVGEQN